MSDESQSVSKGEFRWREFSNWVLGGVLIFVLGAYAHRYLDSPGSAELVGKEAPALELEAADGQEPVRLADYRDKVVLLDFWATWCKVCERQMPRLKEAMKRSKLGDDGAVVLVNTQESGENRAQKVRRYLSQRELEYRTALDDGSAMRDYGVQGLPTMVIVDPDGRVAYVGAGLHPTDEIVTQLREASQS